MSRVFVRIMIMVSALIVRAGGMLQVKYRI